MTLSEWYNNYFAMPPQYKDQILDKIVDMKVHPIISLTVPVYNTKEEWLRQCLDSVLAQVYPHWELCLCDNDSDELTSSILQEYADKDSRIKVTRISPNEGGWKGVQAAVDMSTGDFCGLLDSDDELTPDALYLISYAINRKPTVKVIYTDEIIMSTVTPNKAIPYFKPNFNRTLLLFQHYYSHLTLYEAKLIKQLGLRHCGGSYDYDLSLRSSELVPEKDIYHLPVITYKYRTYPTSTSAVTQESCLRGGCKALQEHLNRMGIKARAERNGFLYQVRLETGALIARPKIDYNEILMAYPDYPEPQLNLMRLTFGD